MMKNGGFKNSSKRLEWVKVEWDNIKILFDLIMEWYENRHLYHRIGFILEYNPDYNLKRLESILPPLSQSKRIKTLDGIIIDIVKNISSKNCFMVIRNCQKFFSYIIYCLKIVVTTTLPGFLLQITSKYEKYRLGSGTCGFQPRS